MQRCPLCSHSDAGRSSGRRNHRGWSTYGCRRVGGEEEIWAGRDVRGRNPLSSSGRGEKRWLQGCRAAGPQGEDG